MHDTINNPAVICVDMKKNRIRIHKATLHMLGNPSHILLLVNPDVPAVAIKTVVKPSSGDQSHKVSKQTMLSDNSIEIYSQSFIRKLKTVVPSLDEGYSYRMTGEIIQTKDIAVFPLSTLNKIDS